MNNKLLLILLIISFSLTSIKLGAIPAQYVWVFDILQGVGNGIMLALAAYRNPDGTSTALSNRGRPPPLWAYRNPDGTSTQKPYIAPRDLPEKD